MRAAEQAFLLILVAVGLILVGALVRSQISIPSPTWLDPTAVSEWLRAALP